MLPDLPEAPIDAAVPVDAIGSPPFAEALLAAALVAAVLFLACGWPCRRLLPRFVSAAGALSASLGFLSGCWWLAVLPQWPPREDRDRFLLLLLPAVVVVELLAALLGTIPVRGTSFWTYLWRRLVWLPRLLVAALAVRVLLHDSVPLTDPPGPNSRSWTPAQAWLIFGAWAVTLSAMWATLSGLAQRSAGRSVVLALAAACAGAGTTVMLSGYFTGGQMGLPLAAALLGVVAVSLVFGGAVDLTGAVGLGVVGLATLVVIGHYFGDLSTYHAVVLVLAPLLCWASELPFVPGWLRGVLRVILVAVPVTVVLWLAHQKFAEDAPQVSLDRREVCAACGLAGGAAKPQAATPAT